MGKSRKDRRQKLNLDKKYFLETGFYLDGVPAKDRFRDLKEIREAWGTDREKIMADWNHKAHGARRPWGWFAFEAGVPVDIDDGGDALGVWVEVERRGGEAAVIDGVSKL